VSFDSIAPYYRWLETVVFGKQLQEARIAFLSQIPEPRRVLIAGEGNGRFLAEVVRQWPDAQIDCVESSGRMIALSREQAAAARVSFIQQDIRTAALPSSHYDLIVTHFLLDCFNEQTLATLIPRLAHAATADARWLIADFFEPPHGWPRNKAAALIAIMYAFFRIAAGIEAGKLVDYRPRLTACGFALAGEMILPNEMVRSELWQRSQPFGHLA
jgi:SAM-dependent methyltransferase